MKKPKITKGEWVAFNDRVESWKNRGKPSMIQITVCEVSDLGYGEQMANRKAISAVPEMVDALIECYKDLKETEMAAYNAGGEMWESDTELLQKVEQALKKAGCHE